MIFKIKLIKSLFLFTVAASLFLLPSFETRANSLKDFEYFKGRWTVKIRGNEKASFNWTLKEDLDNSWFAGAVESAGKKVSADFWRVKGEKLERFAFTTNGLFVRVETAGWKSDKLIFEGFADDASGESKVRETITKENNNQFSALWEMQQPDGKWRVFSDEICTRQT